MRPWRASLPRSRRSASMRPGSARAQRRGPRCSSTSRCFTIGSACTQPWAIALQPKPGPAWRRSRCARQPDILIAPLHSQGGSPLYASDRDVFVFLVDDLNPIEAGRLPDGSPDLYFRGFYAWNSEVGSRTLGISSFFLRAVCQNRTLWGVEQFEELTIRHSKYAASRFAAEA